MEEVPSFEIFSMKTPDGAVTVTLTLSRKTQVWSLVRASITPNKKCISVVSTQLKRSSATAR